MGTFSVKKELVNTVPGLPLYFNLYILATSQYSLNTDCFNRLRLPLEVTGHYLLITSNE